MSPAIVLVRLRSFPDLEVTSTGEAQTHVSSQSNQGCLDRGAGLPSQPSASSTARNGVPRMALSLGYLVERL